jgi:hypothetical protein
MMTFALIFIAGFGCGYGVREVVSRRRYAALRAQYYKKYGLDLPKNVSPWEALRRLVGAVLFKPQQRKPK